MVDFTKEPNRRPWSNELRSGDRLNPSQNGTICHTNLRRLGLETRERHGYYLVAQARPVTTLADLARGD